MKYFSFIVLLSLLYCCNNEKSNDKSLQEDVLKSSFVISSSSKELKKVNDTLYFKNVRFEGIIYELYNASSDTLAIASYNNGVLDGISKKWYSNKKLMEIRSYKEGQKNGKQQAFFENGNKKFEFNAINDQYQGELKEWNIKGDLIHLATYKNGQEEGAQKMWYDNGKIRANYVMLNGKRYGLLGTKNCTNVSDSIFISN